MVFNLYILKWHKLRLNMNIKREMSEEEIARVAETYPALRGNAGTYRDVPGFCKSTSTAMS